MKNKIETFTNETFGEIRTILINDKPYFMASDVAKALGYKRPNDAVTAHCKNKVKFNILISGKEQKVNFITQNEVCRLIMKSKLPSAEKFESWVIDKILPIMYKTSEEIKADLMINTYFSKAPNKQKEILKELLVEIETHNKNNF